MSGLVPHSSGRRSSCFSSVVDRRHAVGGHGDQVAVADEEVHLGERDAVVLELDRPEEDDEELVAVVVELGPLVAVAQVLHRQRVDVEAAAIASTSASSGTSQCTQSTCPGGDAPIEVLDRWTESRR